MSRVKDAGLVVTQACALFAIAMFTVLANPRKIFNVERSCRHGSALFDSRALFGRSNAHFFVVRPVFALATRTAVVWDPAIAGFGRRATTNRTFRHSMYKPGASSFLSAEAKKAF